MRCTGFCCLLLVSFPAWLASNSESTCSDQHEHCGTAHRSSSLLQFQTKANKVEPSRESMETSWRCVGDMHNRTCLFTNLYYGFTGESAEGPSEFMALLVQGHEMDVSEIGTRRANKFDWPWIPVIKEFATLTDLNIFLHSKHVIARPGLSLYFAPLFHDNIGHALFDGLYPAYVGLHRLGMQDRAFRPVLSVPKNCFDADGPAFEAKLKAGEVVSAYLPHPWYNKSLEPTKVELIEVKEQSSSNISEGESVCSFEEGLDTGAVDIASQIVGTGEVGQAKCCKACSQSFGCTRAVLYGDTCYLKGECPGHSENCETAKEGALLCRSKTLFEQTEATVRQVHQTENGFPMEEHTIPVSWIVQRQRLRCMSEGVYETFGKSRTLVRLFEMDRDIASNRDAMFHFQEVAVGSGGAGNLVADDSGAIGGSSEPYNAMAKFRDRMLLAYDLPVDEGNSSESSSKPLDIIVVSNRRFNHEDKENLAALVEQVKRPGKVNAQILDWRDIGSGENRFREHLRRVQQTDVYVSSVGTALQYVPLMKDGKVFVALGAVWQANHQIIPTFMEQQLAGGGTPYLRTLYADPGANVRNGLSLIGIAEDGWRAMVNKTDLLGLLNTAESLVRQGFQIPVPIEENLSEAAKVLVELCRRDPATCQLMQNDRNNGEVLHGSEVKWQCARLLWPECVVYEVGAWRDECNVNRALLRQLRKERGLFAYGAPEE